MMPWLKDVVAWNRTPLAARLEALRKHYCTGPCGQSSDVLETRSATNKALREAREAVLELGRLREEIKGIALDFSGSSRIETSRLVERLEALVYPQTE